MLTLLNSAGHASFREARGPLGFSQRQGAGKFTRDEATMLIDRLQDEEAATDAGIIAAPDMAATQRLMRSMSADQLAAELQRRGWTVTKPSSTVDRHRPG
jgi:hypothetical protein